MIELNTIILPNWGGRNVLDLPNPTEITCQVRHYRNSHPLMRIHLYQLNPERQLPPQLIFHDPIYFKGPFQWQGAEIKISEEPNMRGLLKRLGMYSEAEASTYLRLYQIEASTSYTLQIIAGGVELSTKHITVNMIY